MHRWVTRAWEDRGRPGRLLYAAPTVEHLDEFGELYEQWDMYMTDERPVGVPADRLAVHVRLCGRELDRKLTALRAMATQTSSLIAMLGPEIYAAPGGRGVLRRCPIAAAEPDDDVDVSRVGGATTPG